MSLQLVKGVKETPRGQLVLASKQALDINNRIDTRIHNGLETQYILRLRARYGHVITFTGHSSIFNRHNTHFLSNSPRVFSKTGGLFNSFILFLALSKV